MTSTKLNTSEVIEYIYYLAAKKKVKYRIRLI